MTDNSINKIKFSLYIFAIFFVSYETITYLANDMIMPGMVDVTKEFHVGLEYVASSLSVYLLGNTAIQLFLGPTADRYGKRKVILVGNFFFLMFTILIALSTNIQGFMWGRFLQGTGCAFVAIGYSVIHENFNDKSAVRLLALMGNVTILAPLLGPVLGGIVITYSGWRTIFVIIAAAALIVFIGLLKFTPETNSDVIKRVSPKSCVIEYFSILKNRGFVFGTIATSLALIPLLAWIGLTPVLIMETAKRSFADYIICQIIALSGLSIASILMQFIAGKFSFYKIMLTGTILFFLGAFLNIIFYENVYIIAVNFFISFFGFGLYNGMAIRSIIITCKFSKNMTMSLFVFFESVAMAAGLELVNIICDKYNFSLFSFTFSIFIISLVTVTFMFIFCYMNKNKNWE
ncbi:MAG TPA: MFS transporter [Victivallales bacterium]|nr:MFS transporter [Victivallales bacterium]